ncbi:MAG: hypothetical protein KatS3mg038_1067 [Candidatus Kapaibacterium sp.]|nr:MAG: hypothetical protein KatS3mg038_1067 [Candidatus Kapabacteria bacterium]
MVALLLLLVGVGVGAWSQEVHRDTMVGNIWLEWIRKPTRLVPDTSPIRIVPLGGNDKVWMWPSKLSWLSSERLAVVHPLRYGVVAELYDTAARAQVAGLYYFFPHDGWSEKWHASQLRRLRTGGIGLWGVSFWGILMDAIKISIPTIPMFFELDTMLGVKRIVKDTTWYGRVYPPKGSDPYSSYPFIWRGYGHVYEAESFDGNVCYMMSDTSWKRWWFVLYTDDLATKAVVRNYPLPFAVSIRDTLGRDTTCQLVVMPFAVRASRMGIAARSVTSDSERVIVLFRGENFDDIRAIRLPRADLDFVGVRVSGSLRELEYFVEDGYVIDAAMRGNRFVLSKVWENGKVEWEQYPVNQVLAGARSLAQDYMYYRLKRSRWGGWYLLGRSWRSGLSFVARLNGQGRVTGYYRIEVQNQWTDGDNYAMVDVEEHYADSSFYVLATYDTVLALMKFGMRPSDTTGIDVAVDTTLSVAGRVGVGTMELSPHPVCRGQEVEVRLPEGFDRGEVRLVLYSVGGRVEAVSTLVNGGGVVQLPLSVGTGVYVLQAEGGGGRILRRLVVVME